MADDVVVDSRKEADHELRKRRVADENNEKTGRSSSEPEKQLVEDKATKKSSSASGSLSPGSYWLTRIIFIRSLGFIYFVAFFVALNQNKELLGSNGLLPIPLYLQKVRQYIQQQHNSSSTAVLLETAPTLLWWITEENMDAALDYIAYTGMALSAILIILGAGNAVIFALLWVLYHSLSSVGQTWYSFGWESQLLETGFLAIFLSPVLSLRQLPRHTHSSLVVVWGYRWLIFRIMLGAGLIKIRGDQCWKDLTCMNYHYEESPDHLTTPTGHTSLPQIQPVPNPLSYYLHQSPEIVHMMETAGNHVVEHIVPFFIFLPGPFCALCGLLQILFQFILILSGNLSFLNWLTILPSIFCFQDNQIAFLFPTSTRQAVAELQQQDQITTTDRPIGYYIRKVFSLSLALLLAYLSIPVVQNLFSSRQVMNTSFDTFRIVNTYGAFGSITKERTEVIIEGTHSTTLGSNAEWREIEFHCKPGSIHRRPCIISPYHYRLDWLMWFAAFQNYQYNPWLLHFCGKILAGDPSINSLIAHNPFQDEPPKFVRALHYRYEYTKLGSKEAESGQWWKRRVIGEYLPIVSEANLRKVIENQGWKWYQG